MKSHTLANTLLGIIAVITCFNTSFADDACYSVTGTVTTENVTNTLQIGHIELNLHNHHGRTMFSKTGSLVGNITGSDGTGRTLLSHVAKFPEGYRFVTKGDKAEMTFPFVRATIDGTEEGTPCSFFIHETMSKIAQGGKLFRKVSKVEVFADGYTSNCPDDNENYFELSGELCVDR